MKNKDYREIQLSSSHLVFIFIGILILGVVIFLLGVSVGKKQAQILAVTESSPPTEIEEVKEETPQPIEKSQDSINKELALHQKPEEEPAKTSSQSPQPNLYFVQVGAFTDSEAASAFAQKFKQHGYPTLVLSPLPTDKKSVFRIRIGGYPTREKAEAIRKELVSLKLKKKSDYFIIRKEDQ
jgi:cell division septation protein DedD